MKCEKCEKRFNYAGNIRNYKVKCPHCGAIQSERKYPKVTTEMLRKKSYSQNHGKEKSL